MTEYVHKGFKISYAIKPLENGLYQAHGYVVCQVDEDGGPSLTQKFRTEYPTKHGVEKEIKKIIEKYIDFEWKEFLATQR